jgi:hypothetical protein
MKNLSFILAILMLALALKPCADGFCDETDTCEDHHQEAPQNDSCALLCVCNCCGVLVLHQELPTFTLHSKLKITTKINAHYESHYRFDILATIWQPPQYIS